MSPALQRPHVLIVSDDPELTAFLGEGLVYAGFWTSAIASAVQALEVFRLRSFDVLVLDAALGGIGAIGSCVGCAVAPIGRRPPNGPTFQ